MLDTLTANFAPQFPVGNNYMNLLLEQLTAYRHVPARLILRVAPDDTNAVIAAAGTFEGRFNVPRRSRLWAISGSSAETAGYDLQVRAGDTHQPLFGRRTFYANCTGQFSPSDAPSCRLFFLPKPMFQWSDTEQQDAQIIVQLWNRAAATNAVQVVLWFLAPRDDSQAAQDEFESWSRAQMAGEEDSYIRAIRGPIPIDPFSGAAGDPTHQPFDITTASVDSALVQGAQGYRIGIYNMILYNAGDAIDVTLKNGMAGATLLGPLSTLPAQVGLMLPYDDRPHFVCDPGKAFVLATGAAASPRVTGYVKYRLLERIP